MAAPVADAANRTTLRVFWEPWAHLPMSPGLGQRLHPLFALFSRWEERIRFEPAGTEVKGAAGAQLLRRAGRQRRFPGVYLPGETAIPRRVAPFRAGRFASATGFLPKRAGDVAYRVSGLPLGRCFANLRFHVGPSVGDARALGARRPAGVKSFRARGFNPVGGSQLPFWPPGFMLAYG